MDERLRFVRDALSDRFTMSELCARYGVSRRIGYKWLARYDTEGRPGLRDRSRAPHHCPHQTASSVVELLIAERTAHPHWGARKLLAVLARRHPRRSAWPAPSTVADLLAKLTTERGTALVVVTHSLALAARFPRRYELEDRRLREAS